MLSFSRFEKLCNELLETPKYTEQRDIIKRFLVAFKKGTDASPFAFYRLLLCREDITRVYNIKEKGIMRALSEALLCDYDAMLESFTTQGDIGRTCKDYYEQYYPNAPDVTVLDIAAVNDWLDRVAANTKHEQFVDLFKKIIGKVSPEGLKWIIKLLMKSLKIRVSSKYALEALHPKAYDG